MSSPSVPVRQALRDALPAARKARNLPARNAIRSALAAIENAEAVPSEDASRATAGREHVAGARLGLGAAEAPRQEVDNERALELVSAERDERLAAATQCREAGRPERAAELEAEALALDAFLC